MSRPDSEPLFPDLEPLSPLSGGAAGAASGGRVPLAEALRPRTLNEVIGQAHLLGEGKPLALA